MYPVCEQRAVLEAAADMVSLYKVQLKTDTTIL